LQADTKVRILAAMKGSSRGYRALPLFAALLLSGCDMPVERHAATRPDSGDDLMRILARGTLRVLRPQAAREARFSRDDAALDYEERLIEAYARSKGLRTEWVWVDSRADLISSLLERRGDFIAANFAVTP
jgi:ABC-type amino acid transport substrate-binding protein